MNLENSEKIYKPAGFLLRALSMFINFIIIVLISYGLLFAMVHKVDNKWSFIHPYLFYIWSILSIVILLFTFVVIPIITKGWNLGDKISGIKVISMNGNINKSILKREFIYAFAWAFVMFLVMIIINHTLIFQVSKQTMTPPKITTWEKTRIAIVGSISSLISLVQIFFAITIILNKNKQGFHDQIANCLVVKKEIIVIKNNKKQFKIMPQKINNILVEWVKKE